MTKKEIAMLNQLPNRALKIIKTKHSTAHRSYPTTYASHFSQWSLFASPIYIYKLKDFASGAEKFNMQKNLQFCWRCYDCVSCSCINRAITNPPAKVLHPIWFPLNLGTSGATSHTSSRILFSSSKQLWTNLSRSNITLANQPFHIPSLLNHSSPTHLA